MLNENNFIIHHIKRASEFLFNCFQRWKVFELTWSHCGRQLPSCYANFTRPAPTAISLPAEIFFTSLLEIQAG
jgi:hypothetical protein